MLNLTKYNAKAKYSKTKRNRSLTVIAPSAAFVEKKLLLDGYLPPIDVTIVKPKEPTLRQKELCRKLNNLYTVIEQGTADEYDLERLAAVKQELSQIKEKLAKCAGANSIATINPTHIEKVLKVCRKMLFKNITNESLRMLFDDLVNKITIDAKK